jgi:hypothetical protein
MIRPTRYRPRSRILRSTDGRTAAAEPRPTGHGADHTATATIDRMATDVQTTGGRATYVVEVRGSWLDPLTRLEAPHIETFHVLAQHREAAMTAGLQLYGSAAAANSCTAVGERSARAS